MIFSNISDRVEFLITFGEILEEHSYGLFFSLLSCLSAQDVCKVLDTDFRQDNYTRRAILRRLRTAVETDVLPCHINLFQEIVTKFDILTSKDKRRCATFIGMLIVYMPINSQKQAILKFLKSKSKMTQRYAIGWIHSIKWDCDYQGLILKIWQQNQSTELAHLIINKCDPSILQEHYCDLSKVVQKTPMYNKLHLKIAPYDMSKVEAQKENNPVTYVYLMTKLGHKLDTAEAVSVYEKVLHMEGNTGLLIWCFGQMQLWDSLMKISGMPGPSGYPFSGRVVKSKEGGDET